jgi:putative ABC transport system permease protein
MFLSLRIALASLSAHKLRTVLAILGVFLGALALTGVRHVSLAMERKAELEIQRLGPNLFMAVAGQVRFRRSGSVGVRDAATTFTPRSAETLLHELPGALAGAPFVSKTMDVRFQSVKIPAQVIGTQPVYTRVRGFQPEFGRFFSQAEVRDRAKVCVLGRTIAERLFGSPEHALGRTVYFYRANSRVIGVMEAKGADIVGTNQDEQIFVPITTYMRRFSNQNHISGVYIQLAPETDTEMAKEAATAILRRAHHLKEGQRDDFSVLTARDTIRLQEQALALVRTLGNISSSISFAVGGLGILSIMVLLVRARRLEIGVRRATGARRRDIVRQFLMEAGLLSVAGGILGVFGSMLVGLAANTFGGLPLVFDPAITLTALLGAALLGLAAGAYPAWQAARIEILTVLREE